MFCGVKHKSNETDSHVDTTELGRNLLSNNNNNNNNKLYLRVK